MRLFWIGPILEILTFQKRSTKEAVKKLLDQAQVDETEVENFNEGKIKESEQTTGSPPVIKGQSKVKALLEEKERQAKLAKSTSFRVNASPRPSASVLKPANNSTKSHGTETITGTIEVIPKEGQKEWAMSQFLEKAAKNQGTDTVEGSKDRQKAIAIAKWLEEASRKKKEGALKADKIKVQSKASFGVSQRAAMFLQNSQRDSGRFKREKMKVEEENQGSETEMTSEKQGGTNSVNKVEIGEKGQKGGNVEKIDEAKKSKQEEKAESSERRENKEEGISGQVEGEIREEKGLEGGKVEISGKGLKKIKEMRVETMKEKGIQNWQEGGESSTPQSQTKDLILEIKKEKGSQLGGESGASEKVVPTWAVGCESEGSPAGSPMRPLVLEGEEDIWDEIHTEELMIQVEAAILEAEEKARGNSRQKKVLESAAAFASSLSPIRRFIGFTNKFSESNYKKKKNQEVDRLAIEERAWGGMGGMPWDDDDDDLGLNELVNNIATNISSVFSRFTSKTGKLPKGAMPIIDY